MTTLAGAALSLAKLVSNVRSSTATGGSVTTLIDTARTEPDDFFTGGTIWFLSGANLGKSAVITGWVLSTKTFTFATQTALVAGVLYAASPWDYPRDKLWEAINRALQGLENLPAEDVTLTTVADQEAYSIPAGCEDVRRVEIATQTAAPLQYFVSHHWQIVGSKIRFHWDYAPDTTGYTMRLTYIGLHNDLTTDISVITPYVHPELLQWVAAVEALRAKIQERGEDDVTIPKLLNDAQNMANIMRARYPILDVPRDFTYARA